MRQTLPLGTTRSTDPSSPIADLRSAGRRRGEAPRLKGLLPLVVALLSLAVTNTTCTLPQERKAMMSSYRLARYRLEQCHRMGAAELDGAQMELANRLSAETEAMLAAERWWTVKGSLTPLEETLNRLMERLKAWDPDGDGLSTYAEFMLYDTSWKDPDTDGDGYLDGTEVLVSETDPLDPCAVPLGLKPEKPRTRPCPALEGLELSRPCQGLPSKKE